MRQCLFSFDNNKNNGYIIYAAVEQFGSSLVS